MPRTNPSLSSAAPQPAVLSGKMNVRVKNSYNREAPGSVISSTRDMTDVFVTSIVLKVRSRAPFEPSLLFPRLTLRSHDLIEINVTLLFPLVPQSNVTLVDVVSTRMMGQYGFLATVFDSFKRHRISVDVVATSEVSVSL